METPVTAIKSSKVWHEGHNAIVMCETRTITVRLPIRTGGADCGHYLQKLRVKSKVFYTPFTLLRSIEAGFRLPCLNHACDATTNVMSDLFKSGNDRDND